MEATWFIALFSLRGGQGDKNPSLSLGNMECLATKKWPYLGCSGLSKQ